MLSKPTDEELANGGEYPPGYCQFPQYDSEFFKQLTGEHLVTRLVRGYPKPEWQKTRERNEALDCRVYARAAAYVAGLDKLKDENWNDLAMRASRKPKEPVTQPAKPVAAKPPASRDNWFGDNRGYWDR